MSFVGALRRRLLTPGTSATDLEVRGFHIKNRAARERLERVGQTFLAGYAHAAEARVPADAVAGLEQLPRGFRGFAYEGAAMALAVRDGLPFGRGGRVAAFLAGPGAPHVYMTYVGVGWAMARLPRFRWSTLYAPDPLLRWLVLDGYGFHQAYFKTRKYVHEQFREERFPWPADGPAWHAARVIDQGVGRAMWFVGGADADRVIQLLDAFPESRRADLYSGAGLAATYAGGADEDELRRFWQHAGPYQPAVAQGSAFGAAARVRAGLVEPHNEMATRVFCKMAPDEAAKVTDEALRGLPSSGEVPAYEIWRHRIGAEFAARSDR